MEAYEIEATIVSLESALTHAKAAGLGEHFTSDIKHLINTAKAVRESL